MDLEPHGLHQKSQTRKICYYFLAKNGMSVVRCRNAVEAMRARDRYPRGVMRQEGLTVAKMV